jgi:hypothetical protein
MIRTPGIEGDMTIGTDPPEEEAYTAQLPDPVFVVCAPVINPEY